MPISYEKIVQGSVFRFLVGAEQQPMTIHSGLVAEQSPELRALVSGFMEEAKTGTTMWPEVEPSTFARFAQYVYTGDYPQPSGKMLDNNPSLENGDAGDVEIPPPPPLEDNESPAEEPPVVEEWTSTSTFKIGKLPKTKNCKFEKKKGRSIPDHVKFHDIEYDSPLSEFKVNPGVNSNESPREDFTPVFLGHARLYTLADKWNIEPLKSLVLYKLHATLCAYTPYEARYGDVVELIRYVYEHTPDRNEMDKLRELVTRYVAYEQVRIAGSDPCLALVEEGGSFARDLLSMVVARVTDSLRIIEPEAELALMKQSLVERKK